MTGVIIQARMSSTRLPGKVLRQAAGRPLLSYLLERVRRMKKVDKILLATSTDATDDSLEAFASREGVELYRGSLNDVLDRYFQAAVQMGLTHVVRLTGDCPLIDPQICDRLVDFYDSSQVDYAALSPEFAEGLDCEVVSFEALALAHQRATLRSHREHVTLYVREHKDLFRQARLSNAEDESRYRVTVDDPEDFAVVGEIIERLHDVDGCFSAAWPEVRAFLDRHPGVMALNAHIERNAGLKKSLADEGRADAV